MSSGYCVNSHQLVDIIKKELLRAGWSIRSELNSRDYVFYSQGSDGNQDIYIRVAAGLYDFRTNGFTQKYDPDGYTGYVNFFAYQYFPEDGLHGNVGSNEVGRSGPIINMIQGENTPINYEEYDMIGSKIGQARRYVHWQTANSSDGNYQILTTIGSDGHTKFYFDKAGNTNRYRVNLDRDYGNDFASVSGVSLFPTSPAHGFGEYYYNQNSNEHFIYTLDTSNPSNIMIHNLTTNTFTKGISGAPWANTASGGFMVKGMARNGITRLYIGRGSISNSWAYYDIETNTWSSPAVNLPATFSSWCSALIIPKELSGYQYDRLYVTRGNSSTGFYSIYLDDNGNTVGSWFSNKVLPKTATLGNKLLSISKYIIFIPADNANNLYYYRLPETDPTIEPTWSWLDAGNFFTPASAGGGFIGAYTSSSVTNHLVSRVRVTEGEVNNYWTIVDKDRAIIITKDDSDNFWYNYVGLFNTYYVNNHAALSLDATSGTNTIYVDNVSNFKISESYTIVDITGDASTHVVYNTIRVSDNLLPINDGYICNFGPSEIVTIAGINQDSGALTLSDQLSRSYKSGSKIGKDPQPVMVRAEGFDQAYVLNSMVPADNHSSKDPPYQRYGLRKLYDITNLTDSIPRTFGGSAYPIALHGKGQNNVVSSEIRGTLRSVYWVGDDFISGKIYEVDGERYLAFKPYDNSVSSSPWSNTGKILVGPLE